jgi:hypothetical protein
VADRMTAEIAIGGPIPARLLDDLIRAIKAENIYLTAAEASFDAHSAADLLKAARDGDQAGPLRLLEHEVADGCFDILERFLIRNNIAYDRWADGIYEFDPELVQFRPGMKKVCVCTTKKNKKPVVELAALKEALTALNNGAVARAINTLGKALGTAIDPLPPLQIVEECQTTVALNLRASIDWTLLARQKHWLLTQKADEAAGLVELIDAIQDAAVDDAGVPEENVFPNIEE